MELLLILFFIATLIIGIPIIISLYLFRFLKRKFDNNWMKYLAFIPVVIMTYFIFLAIFPSQEFYKEDFTELTKLEFPTTSKIIYKDASYPDQFGDYTSVFAVRNNRTEYDRILNQLIEIGYNQKDEMWSSREIDEALKVSEANILHEYSKTEIGGKIFYAAFLSDHKTIIFSRVSW